MTKIDDFERVGNLLGDACEAAASPSATDVRTGGRTQQDRGRVLALAWAEIAGPDVAANARPVQLKRGRLVVSVSSSAWAHTLQDMSEGLRERLNERMGQAVIEKLVFRHAGWEERSGPGRRAGARAQRPRRAALSDEEAEALAQVNELDLPAQIRDRIAHAMKAAFVRGEQDSVR